jgi:radical S-adenosyl methionine domain-containing protein 2
MTALPELHLRVVTSLAERGASKITFSGGEPLLVKWLPDLLRRARSMGVTTCVVTNGSLLTAAWLARVAEDLDWLTLSVDSVSQATNLRIGRADKSELTRRSAQGGRSLELFAPVAQSLGVGMKINTVVTKHNVGEDMSRFVNCVLPVRWKIMQAMPVDGQEQRPEEAWSVALHEFNRFVDRHRPKIVATVAIVPEPIDLIRGSYVMIDPWGRIFESTSGRHQYLAPIESASSSTIESVLNRHKLAARDGLWNWDRTA